MRASARVMTWTGLKNKAAVLGGLVLLVILVTFGRQTMAGELPAFTQLVEKNGPAVVNISAVQKTHRRGGAPFAFPGIPEDDPIHDFFRRFMPPVPQGEGQSQSLGSGFIVSVDGYVLTNAHVVDGADEVTVKLTDRREFLAQVLGADRQTDVALLKIEASDLPVVRVGRSTDLKVGEWVLAIGSPFGFENTVTAGIVSGKGRSLPDENYVPFIQTDVAINPGNSGGPLFNLEGEVVGINSQIYSRTGGFMGLSFAIPIDLAMSVSEQLKATGKVSRGKLGVTIQPVTAELAKAFGLSSAQGALVADVEPGSAAGKAGLRPGDVILGYNGRVVVRSSDLPQMVGATRPGSKVGIEVWRDGRKKTLQAVIGELNEQVRQTAAQSERGAEVAGIGLLVSDMNTQEAKRLGFDGGVRVERATGAAASAGIRRGDIITAINGAAVHSSQALAKRLEPFGKGERVAVLLHRGGRNLFVSLRLPD